MLFTRTLTIEINAHWNQPQAREDVLVEQAIEEAKDFLRGHSDIDQVIIADAGIVWTVVRRPVFRADDAPVDQSPIEVHHVPTGYDTVEETL